VLAFDESEVFGGGERETRGEQALGAGIARQVEKERGALQRAGGLMSERDFR